MGPIPRLSYRGITDFASCLRDAEQRRLERAVSVFQERFPQSRLGFVLKAFRSDFPLGTHLFWLFNSSGFARENLKLGRNRDILVGIDTRHRLAGLTVGYGLEPFLGREALDHVLRMAVPEFQEGRYAAGIQTIIKGLSLLMEAVCRELSDLLDLDSLPSEKEKAGIY